MKRKSNDSTVYIFPGQISIFDFEISEEKKETTIPPKQISNNDVSKVKNKEIPPELQNCIDAYWNVPRLSRIIQYAGGGLGIELTKDDSFETLYYNSQGKEEFIIPKETPVLPFDKIVYYKSKFEINTMQNQRLHELINRFGSKIKRIIHRNGDKNILIELSDKVIDILPNGWTLDFTSINTVNCDPDEIINMTKNESLLKVQSSVKTGDIVEAYHGKSIIKGEIIREYGIGNQILNIDFENHTKVTAIGRQAVIKIFSA